jgi:hypothetical protein
LAHETRKSAIVVTKNKCGPVRIVILETNREECMETDWVIFCNENI